MSIFNQREGVNIMTNNKLLKLAALALVSAATFTTQAAFADGLSCSDWSFNNAGCAAYLKPSQKKAEAIVTASTDKASCADWSFNNPGCAAYLKPTEKKAVAIVTASAGGTVCSDWSFNDSGCAAYIRR
ncbi:MAG: hypothetical protein KGJ19_05370 [Betaproteobacteria bacterium]|nr:hypothetical protein [Betaproteobacteria bacterium]